MHIITSLHKKIWTQRQPGTYLPPQLGFIVVSVSDGMGRGQPACQEEWKMKPNPVQ